MSNIFFICGGVFDGIEKVIVCWVNIYVIGFKNKEVFIDVVDWIKFLQYISYQDFCIFGFIFELLGCLLVLAYLEFLDIEVFK